MKREIKVEAYYPFAPAEVWEALTNSEAMAEWLMTNDFEPLVGHRFTLRDRPRPGWDGTVSCEVVELIPERRLAFTWKGGGNAIPETRGRQDLCHACIGSPD